MRPLLSACLAVALCVGAASPSAHAATPRWVGMPEAREPTERDRERSADHALRSARSLLKQDKLEQAEAVIANALRARPQTAALHREHARILAALERRTEAQAALEHADTLDPPPGPLPTAPLTADAGALLVVLLPPAPDARPERRPNQWPDGEVARELEQRLRLRLPGVQLAHAAFDTVAAARAGIRNGALRGVISLRVERIYCGDTVKDGRFGLATLRVGAARPGARAADASWARRVIDAPRLARGCRRESIARALELALAMPKLRELIEAAPSLEKNWSSAAVRALFPGIEAHIDRALAEGERRLASGRLADALTAFERAAAVDPEDPIPASYVRDVEATLALSREIARRSGGDGDTHEPHMTPAERAAIEAQLASERMRREALLTVLAVLGEQARLPSSQALRGLVPVALAKPASFGVQLARQRAGGAVRARAALAPDGSELARYYFPERDSLPVLREEDTNGDGTADRWIGYAGDLRAEIWESADDSGRPDVRLVLAADGNRLARVEVDRDADGRPESVMQYREGGLRMQAVDSDADGQLDVFERFASDGRVRVREEDLDGDGVIDIRSEYRAGKLVSREYSRGALPEG